MKLRFLALGSGKGPDDIKLFIKDEPTKQSKLDIGRYRLIWAFSVEDQVVDRLLFSDFFKIEVQHFDQVVSKTGWSPIPGGYRLFNATFRGQVLATDCSCFDWTYPPWLPKLFMQTLLQRARGVSQLYCKMVENRFEQVLGPQVVVRLPSGKRFRQLQWGVMKSGWLLTLMGNSNAMLILFSIAWKRSQAHYGSRPLPLLWAMGDDVIMSWYEGLDPSYLVTELEKLGVIIKQFTFNREFAGFEILPSGHVTPLYPNKHRFHLAYHTEEELKELSAAYGCLYALAKERPPVVQNLVQQYSPYTWCFYEVWARGGDVGKCVSGKVMSLFRDV